MLSLYPAIFYKEKTNDISVVFPDLNHLATYGENINEAMEMAIDCLAGYIFSARLDGEVLPQPTPIEEVDVHCEDDEDDDYESAFVNLVAVDVDDYAIKHFEKPVKKTLVVPDWLNRKAMELDINFSAALKNRLLHICSAMSGEDTSEEFHGKGISSALAGALSPRFSAVGAVPGVAGAAAGVTAGIAVAGAVNTLFGLVKTPDAEKNVKKTLTLPKWLNERAISMGINFSAVLMDALLEACKEKLESKKL